MNGNEVINEAGMALQAEMAAERLEKAESRLPVLTVSEHIAASIDHGEQFIAETQRTVEQMRLIQSQIAGTELGDANVYEVGEALTALFGRGI